MSFFMSSIGAISYILEKHGIESLLTNVQYRDYVTYTSQTWDRKFPYSCAIKGLCDIHESNIGYEVFFLMYSEVTVVYTCQT